MKIIMPKAYSILSLALAMCLVICVFVLEPLWLQERHLAKEFVIRIICLGIIGVLSVAALCFFRVESRLVSSRQTCIDLEGKVTARTAQLTRTIGTLKEEIAERKAAEDSLRKKEWQLVEAQKMEAIGLLAGGIAHEFNNLLQAIQGYASCATEATDPNDEAYGDMQQVLKAAHRAATLTRQLLSFSRRQPLEQENLDPNQLVRELTRMVKPLIGENILLESRLADDLAAVYADRAALQQVLLNLCLNARDAMLAPSEDRLGGCLLLQTQGVVLSRPLPVCGSELAPGPYVVFAVADTGCGITAEVQQHLFEPFFSTKEVGKGTGLGLATAYGIVQQHKGAIQVESEPGQGTTFKIYLPAVGAVADKSTSPAEPVRGGNETILLADDEPLVRKLFLRTLGQNGYRVLAASQGVEALRMFEENRAQIALVVLDPVMPQLGGYEVYQRIKQMAPETRVIFCTGYDPETKHALSLIGEGQVLLRKPVDTQALLRAVREALDQPAADLACV
jgi:signal transduction histidine kinase/ActR/RegA family two-component response regulator